MLVYNLSKQHEWLYFIPETYLGILILIFLFAYSILHKIIVNLNYLQHVKMLNRLVILSLFFFFFLVYTEYSIYTKFDFFIFNFLFKKTFINQSIYIIITILLIFYVFIVNLLIFKSKILNNFSFSFIIIILLSFMGSLLLLISNDFLTFFISFELVSLSLYGLVAINNYSVLSSFSSMKYYIIGAVSSIILLLGIVFLYSLTGITNFLDLTLYLSFITSSHEKFLPILISILFIFIPVFFKLGLFPFHFWLPEIYNGITYKVLFYIFIIPKLSFIFVFYNLYFNIFFNFITIFNPFLILFCVLSIIFGTLGAILQKNIKTLLAFSSILNIGYILIALTSFTEFSLSYLIFYFLNYVINITLFLLIIFLLNKFSSNDDYNIVNIYHLTDLFRLNPTLATILGISIFSISGLPPFGGFYAKYLILSDLLLSGQYLSIFFILLFSILSTFYYIRIVKFIFFEKLIDFSKKRRFSHYFGVNITILKNDVNKKIITLICCLFIINILISFFPFLLLDFILKYFF